ncbi:uncharacterized protein LOC126481548 [Schistocerca serialis cubense]|uniref:uncharacterized protein LOC126481548 n=1 Tax=Schistocerca serialis cubense TaxID=2023355 RepID=UPI00214F2D04|nr:uncharacterized protein LOC126481548 [Schistocerca serialis cubense]
MPRGAQLFLLLALVTAARVLDTRAESALTEDDSQSSSQDSRVASHDRNEDTVEDRPDGEAPNASFRRGREAAGFDSRVDGRNGIGDESRKDEGPWLAMLEGSYIPAGSAREMVQREATIHENPGVWFGPRYGRRSSCGVDAPLKWRPQVEKRAAKSPALWFGPRVGRSSDGEPKGEDAVWTNDEREFKDSGSQRQDRRAQPPGLWFGPRVGRRSDAQVDDMLWFGPRPGRSVDMDKQEQTGDVYDDGVATRDQRAAKHPGLWFGPRFGR